MQKSIIIALALFVAFGGVAAGRDLEGVTVYNTESNAPAVRIRYKGSSSTATFSNSTTAVVVNDGGVSTTVTLDPSTALSTPVGSIEAATNSAGAKNFEVEYVCALSTDVPSNNVLGVSANVDLSDGKWHEVMLWNSINTKHYDAASYGDHAGARWLKQIYGNPAGTGNLTINVYIDGTEVDEMVWPLPTYTLLNINSNTTHNNVEPGVRVDLGPDGIYAGPKQRMHIRATRATTTSAGSIGGILTVR